MYFWKYSSICFLWEEKIPGVHGSGQEGFGMAREAEDRRTQIQSVVFEIMQKLRG